MVYQNACFSRVDGVGYMFLTRTVLSEDKHPHIGGSDQFNSFHDGLKCRSVTRKHRYAVLIYAPFFQLGIRQAFDKPVVLIQEKGTPKIFDIAPLRYLEYSKEMKYHEVLESQKSLQEAIEATKAAEGDSGNINSIVKLMALSSPAIIPNLDNSNKEVLALDVMRSQMNDLKMMMEMMVHEGRKGISRRSSIAAIEYERIVNKLDKISSLKMDIEQADREYTKLMRDTEEIMMNCGGELDHRMFKYLMDKIYRQREEYFSTR